MSKTIEDKLNEGRQFRNIDASRLEVRTLEDGGRIVEGYATTFDMPYELRSADGYTLLEVIDRGAFDNCDMSDVIMQYDHTGRVFARTSNGTLSVNVDEIGLHIRARLDGTELGRRIYEEIDGGYTDKMSFGFSVREARRDVTKDDERTVVTRHVVDVSKLWDVSAVSIPANDATTINARDLFNGVIKEIEAERLKRKKLLTKLKMEGIKL